MRVIEMDRTGGARIAPKRGTLPGVYGRIHTATTEREERAMRTYEQTHDAQLERTNDMHERQDREAERARVAGSVAHETPDGLPAIDALTDEERDAARVLVHCMRLGVQYDWTGNGHLSHVIYNHARRTEDGFVARWNGHTAREAWDRAREDHFGREWDLYPPKG